MKVIKEPLVQFTCNHCGAVNAGEPHEFERLNTYPPSWRAKCEYCRCHSTCYPSVLIARTVGAVFG